MDNDPTRENEIQIKRHSFAHLLAMAVIALFKEAKLGIGAAIENGFYQEILIERDLTSEDLENITEEMIKLINLELPYQQITISKNEAFDILHLQGQLFKTEILEQISEEMVSFYKTGNEFFDLCKGPHVNHTGNLGPFILTQVSKVHWNNDESRPVLQRIYGIAFNSEEELEKFIAEQNQIKEKNYLKTGAKIDFFMSEHENQIPILLPKGLALMEKLKDRVYRANLESGFKLIKSPLMQVNTQTNTIDLATYGYSDLITFYKSKKRSYKSIPFKLSQVNYFFATQKAKKNVPFLDQIYTQADIGIVITYKDDIKAQINQLVSKLIGLFKFFGLEDFKLELALKGSGEDKYYGNHKEWLKLQDILVESVKTLGVVVYESVNTAERVGPGFNFIYEDIQKNRWKLANIYFDIERSHKENIKYIDTKGKTREVYLIVKSFALSIERIFALIIEKYQGACPIWLAPIHTNIIPVSKKYNNYAKQVYFKIMQEGLSATIDISANTMQSKIKNSQDKLIPYMLIVGQKEQLNNTVSVRPRSDQDLGMMKIDEFIGIIKQELRNYQTF